MSEPNEGEPGTWSHCGNMAPHRRHNYPISHTLEPYHLTCLGTQPYPEERSTRSEHQPSMYEEALKDLLRAALPIISYVSMGRGYVDVEPYPDAAARRVNAEIRTLLGEEPTG